MNKLISWQLKIMLSVVLLLGGLSGCQSEALNQLTTTTAQTKQLYSLAGTEALGNPQGEITLVVISSYECHYCRKDYPIIKKFVASHPSVKLIYKSYLAFGLDTLVDLQYAALAAAKQQQFSAMNEALFTTDKALNETTITEIAKDLGLNLPKFSKDQHSQKVAQQVVANTELVDQLGIQGIPTVIMTSTKIMTDNTLPQYIQVGFISTEVLEEMLEAVQKK